MNRMLAMVPPVAALAFDAFAAPVGDSLHPVTDAYDGWRLAVQAWTFNHFTFSEAVEKVASLGLDWIEAYPGQQVRPGVKGVKMGPDLSSDERASLRQMLANAGVRLVNFGVVDLGVEIHPQVLRISFLFLH
jgi:hypothetical protein